MDNAWQRRTAQAWARVLGIFRRHRHAVDPAFAVLRPFLALFFDGKRQDTGLAPQAECLGRNATVVWIGAALCVVYIVLSTLWSVEKTWLDSGHQLYNVLAYETIRPWHDRYVYFILYGPALAAAKMGADLHTIILVNSLALPGINIIGMAVLTFALKRPDAALGLLFGVFLHSGALFFFPVHEQNIFPLAAALLYAGLTSRRETTTPMASALLTCLGTGALVLAHPLAVLTIPGLGLASLWLRPQIGREFWLSLSLAAAFLAIRSLTATSYEQDKLEQGLGRTLGGADAGLLERIGALVSHTGDAAGALIIALPGLLAAVALVLWRWRQPAAIIWALYIFAFYWLTTAIYAPIPGLDFQSPLWRIILWEGYFRGIAMIAALPLATLLVRWPFTKSPIPSAVPIACVAALSLFWLEDVLSTRTYIAQRVSYIRELAAARDLGSADKVLLRPENLDVEYFAPTAHIMMESAVLTATDPKIPLRAFVNEDEYPQRNYINGRENRNWFPFSDVPYTAGAHDFDACPAPEIKDELTISVAQPILWDTKPLRLAVRIDNASDTPLLAGVRGRAKWLVEARWVTEDGSGLARRFNPIDLDVHRTFDEWISIPPRSDGARALVIELGCFLGEAPSEARYWYRFVGKKNLTGDLVHINLKP